MQKCILENRMKHNMDQEKVIVIDFGGQYNQLVARRVRECNAVSYTHLLSRIEGQIRGIKGMVEKDCYCPDIILSLIHI